jgi:hypothetical protein
MWAELWRIIVLGLLVLGGLTAYSVLIAIPVSLVLRRGGHRRYLVMPDDAVDRSTAAPLPDQEHAPDGVGLPTQAALVDDANDAPKKFQRARSWSQVPSWVRQDKEWAAAVVLLGSDAIASRTTAFVDFPARRIDWLGLRMEASSWSPRDRLLVEVAYDLAYSQHEGGEGAVPHVPVTVADLTRGVDHPDLELIHSAVSLRRTD